MKVADETQGLFLSINEKTNTMYPKVSESTPVFLGIIKLHLRHGNLHGRREAVGRLEPMEIKIEKGAKIVRFRE